MFSLITQLYFPLIKEVVEVGSLMEDGKAKESGSDEGGSSGEE